jgi:hypothetical protein
MSRPRVSVIVTAYNYERYLPEAIDSALAQTYPADRLEIIVVDDGSTDGTPDVIAGYGDRIRSIRRPNGGLIAATNSGLEAATGELLCLLDADNAWPHDRVEVMVAALEADPTAGLVHGDMELIDAEGQVTHASWRQTYGFPVGAGNVLGRLLENNFIDANGFMIRAELLPHVHPIPEFVPYQDWWMVTQAAAVAPFASVDAVVSRYRHHGDNMGGHNDHAIKQLPMRRRLLAALAGGMISPGELAVSADVLVQCVGIALSAIGARPHVAVPVTSDDRRAAVETFAAASAALDRGAAAEAFALIVRAYALDPHSATVRAVLTDFLTVARGLEPAPAPDFVADVANLEAAGLEPWEIGMATGRRVVRAAAAAAA